LDSTFAGFQELRQSEALERSSAAGEGMEVININQLKVDNAGFAELWARGVMKRTE
jgi:hypothetical protein